MLPSDNKKLEEEQKAQVSFEYRVFAVLAFVIVLYTACALTQEWQEWYENQPGSKIRPSVLLASSIHADFDTIKDITPTGTLRKYGRILQFRRKNDPRRYRAWSNNGVWSVYDSMGSEVERFEFNGRKLDMGKPRLLPDMKNVDK